MGTLALLTGPTGLAILWAKQRAILWHTDIPSPTTTDDQS